jgi:3-mercaptopropionate dioxygenase
VTSSASRGRDQSHGTAPAPPELALFIRRIEPFLRDADEARLLTGIAAELRQLVAKDDWLPPRYAEPDNRRYRQFLLYLDPDDRFSIVSFVWGPGQGTPIHDHGVWGVIGVLRGAELSQRFAAAIDAPPQPIGLPDRIAAGGIDTVSPRIGDIHQVTNAITNGISVSIHVYGGDISRIVRHSYPSAGGRQHFVSHPANGNLTPPFVVP